MKPILIIILLSIPFISSSQEVIVHDNFEILGKDTINRTTNQQKDGVWVYYEVAYESISCFTSSKSWYKKGIRFIISKGSYANGNKIGEWNYFYKSGVLKKKEYFSNLGMRIGTTIEYYKNGKIKSNQHWLNGTLKNQIVFFKNGKTKFRSFHQKQKVKSFSIFYETGELKYKGKEVEKWEIKELVCLEKNGTLKKIRPVKFGELLSNENLIEYL